MPEIVQEQMMLTSPDALIQAVPYDQPAGNNSHFSLEGLGRMAAIGLSSAVAFFGAERLVSTTVTPPEASANCILGSPNYNTVACGPHGPVAKNCLQATTIGSHDVSAKYIKGSADKYKIHLRDEDMHGCNPAGVRKISVFEELRKGSSGTFERNSKIVTTKSNYNKVINTAVEAPYNCTADGAGSAVELAVSTTWQPNKSYKVPGRPMLSSTRTYDVQTVC